MLVVNVAPGCEYFRVDDAPERSLVLGVPARVVREVRDDDARWTVGAAAHYVELSKWYRENLREVE